MFIGSRCSLLLAALMLAAMPLRTCAQGSSAPAPVYGYIPQPSDSPRIAPLTEKELGRALEALRTAKLKSARGHLRKLERIAPGNPDVNFLLGVYNTKLNNLAAAKQYWRLAVENDPNHTSALAALGTAALSEGDLRAAVEYLIRAAATDPSSWRYHEQLAEAYLRLRSFPEAHSQAEEAIALGKDSAVQARLILAKAAFEQKDPDLALKSLDVFLALRPKGPQSIQARRLLSLSPDSAATYSNLSALDTMLASPSPMLAATDLLPSANWRPPDVDDRMPAVQSAAGCPLAEIQIRTGERVRGFVDAVNRISATESLQDELIDRYGISARRESRRFSYVADFHQTSPGMFDVKEYRNNTPGLDLFPQHVATIGLTSLALVFHPTFQDDYNFSCEGLADWRGDRAWQLHFRQRLDRPKRLRGYSVHGRLYPLSLRGRAWISTANFQILAIETDVTDPIPEIRLRSEHTSVEYAPIHFRSHNIDLWLPKNADVYFDFQGRRTHRRHSFTNYELFSVDDRQQISVPEIPPVASQEQKP